MENYLLFKKENDTGTKKDNRQVNTLSVSEKDNEEQRSRAIIDGNIHNQQQQIKTESSKAEISAGRSEESIRESKANPSVFL